MKSLPRLKQNEILAPYTTFKIGGPAKFFVVVKNEEEAIQALKWAKENNLKYFILGKGANILISDQGFAGLVIKNEMRDFNIRDSEVIAGSGTNLNELIANCAENNLRGLEFLAGIPSTVGGAVAGNAGTPNKAIGDFVKEVKVLTPDLSVKVFLKEECGFAYRRSIFQESEYIILSVSFELEKGSKEAIREDIKSVIEKKKKSQPLDLPSAGCIFKNPKGISAGQLIDELGLKGKNIGQAKISEKHANYIVNLGGATADQVVQLISYIKQQVRDKKGIQLENEIKLVGFD